MLTRFNDFLTPFRRILLTTHENPDPDAAGALLGLGSYLSAQGKEVRAMVCPALPLVLRPFDGEGLARPFQAEEAMDLAAWADLWLLVDAAEPRRLGALQAAFDATGARRGCLDHHLPPQEGFDARWDGVFSDPTASASSELVYALAAPRLGRPLPAAMAEALYAGIVDDTGSFRFDNATPRVHRFAAELIEDGVRPDRVHQALYHQGSPAALRIAGRAYASLQLLSEGHLAVMRLGRQDMQDCGAGNEDIQNLVNRPLELRGVEVSLLLHEQEGGLVKASLRSRGRVDVNAVCRGLGGGGHRLASGAKLQGSLEESMERLLTAVIPQLMQDLSST